MVRRRQVIIDTRTRWTITIPEEVPDIDKVAYAWEEVQRAALAVEEETNIPVEVSVPLKFRKDRNDLVPLPFKKTSSSRKK